MEHLVRRTVEDPAAGSRSRPVARAVTGLFRLLTAGLTW